MKPQRSLLIILQKMRIPDLGAIQRVGDLAMTRAKLDVHAGNGQGHYYLLEFDHENIARAIYVDESGAAQSPKLLQIEEYVAEPAEAVSIEGKMARLDTTYQPEPLPQFRKRMIDEKTAHDAKLVK
ncbi:MAG: hypothetical protein KF716_29985 [Anaerolineae bacterium]|nr:hypothetical protein [Anaerolineae bacterium]